MIDGKTGFLRPSDTASFADRLAWMTASENAAKLKQMGQAGRRHVKSNFSLDAFTRSLDGHLQTVSKVRNGDAETITRWVVLLPVTSISIVVLLVWVCITIR